MNWDYELNKHYQKEEPELAYTQAEFEECIRNLRKRKFKSEVIDLKKYQKKNG